MAATFLQAAPCFAARDVDALAGFYSRVLGFTERYRSPVYIVLAHGDAQLHLFPQREGKHAGQGTAYFFVQGIDDLHAACQAGAKVIDALKDQPYGLRDFLLEDPEGNRVGIAERL